MEEAKMDVEREMLRALVLPKLLVRLYDMMAYANCGLEFDYEGLLVRRGDEVLMRRSRRRVCASIMSQMVLTRPVDPNDFEHSNRLMWWAFSEIGPLVYDKGFSDIVVQMTVPDDDPVRISMFWGYA